MLHFLMNTLLIALILIIWDEGEGIRYSGTDPQIHYGADDNASGTASLMEIAAGIARAPLPRSVIFMGFTGEECSVYDPAVAVITPIPTENTVMMLNRHMSVK